MNFDETYFNIALFSLLNDKKKLITTDLLVL